MNELERARVNSIGKRVVIQKDTGLMRGTIVDVTRGDSIKDDKFTVSWDDYIITIIEVTQISSKYPEIMVEIAPPNYPLTLAILQWRW